MRALRFLHRWVGLLLALPLLVQGLTGAVLTLEPWLPTFGPGVAVGVGAPVNDVLAAARLAGPAGMVVSRYVAPEREGAAAVVQFSQPGGGRGPRMSMEIDPATAKPLGPAHGATGVMEWLKRLHTNLLVPEWGGRQLVGWMGVGLLVLTVLGVPLWWPAKGRWREGFTVPVNARGARLQRRLHGAMGVWIWVMMLATSSTGIVQGFPQTARAVFGGAAPGGAPGGRPEGGRPEAGRPEAGRPEAGRPEGGRPEGGRPEGGRGGRGEGAAVPDVDAGIRLAAEAVPGTVLRMAFLPGRPGEGLRLVVGPPGTEGVLTATTVLVDAAGRAVQSIQRPGAGGDAVVRWARDLHYGQGFGPVWRGLTVAVGLAIPAFGVTGFLLWTMKRRTRRQLDAVRLAAVRGGETGGETGGDLGRLSAGE